MQNSDFPNIPHSWQVKTLGEVCDILDNMRKPINATEREQRLKNSAHKYAYYGATGQVGYIDDFLCDFESILLGEDGAPFLEPFKDKAYIVSGKYWVNNHAHILRAKKNLTINKFLCHFLNIVDYMPYVSGTTRLKLNQSAMKQIKIPIPSLEIQRRIVKRLDEAFARIENGTKHLKSAKDNLTKYKQSLLKSAFNGTLTQDCPLSQCESATPSLHSKSISQSSLRGSNATEAIHKESTDSTESSLRANEMSVAIHKKEIDCHESLRDSRNDENSPSLAEGARGWVSPRNDNALDCHADKSVRNDDKDLLNGKSANLPQGWTIKTLGEIGEIVSGGTPTTSQADNFGGNIAWITPADLSNHNNKFISQGKRNISEKGLKNSSARLMPKGTILFSSRAPIGYVAIASNPLCTNQGFKSLIPNENIFSEFVYYYLLNSKSLAESYASGTTFKEISAKSFSKLPIPIPPLETQKQIVAILERHFTSADKVSAYIESCLTKAKQLKSSLLKSAFEGKL